MTSTTHQNPSLSEDDLVEVEREGSDDEEDGGSASSPTPEPAAAAGQKKERKTTSPDSPAYVAPISKIGPISPISPVSHAAPQSLGIPVSPSNRPPLPKFVGSFLVGKTVDEAGDIVDETTGQVLARAGGDLPSIVGRKVSNSRGDILGDDGELLGYVADLEIERKAGSGASPSMPGWPPMRSLSEMMGRANASLMVDHLGNILDAGGNVVGKFHDNNNPAHRREREEQQRAKEAEQAAAMQAAAERAVRQAAAAQKAEEKGEVQGEAGGEEEDTSSPPQPEDGEHEPECSCARKKPRRTEEERRQNAQAWRKENPGESPSDIFLDVKSTTEGIQLTIRIPTVFNGSQVRPTVQFS
jgi:hypothetical protein